MLGLAGCGSGASAQSADRFNATQAFSLIKQQVAVGQRPAGSRALRAEAVRLRKLLPNGRFEPFPSKGPQKGLRNIVSVVPGRTPAILIGAHYDTQYRPKGFVGANDSAAGTAALVELARNLPAQLPPNHREVRFVLFDGEEAPPGCTDARFATCALRGSRAYAAAHPGEIGQMILLDYIANKGARIRMETNSNPALWSQLRQAAQQVGAEQIFPPETQEPIIDDHIPFLERSVPAIDLIDWSYRYKNGVRDTVDKLDPAVLNAVGETVAQLAINLSGQ